MFQGEFGCAVEPLIFPLMHILWGLVIQLWDNPEELTSKIHGTMTAPLCEDKKIGVLFAVPFLKTNRCMCSFSFMNTPCSLMLDRTYVWSKQRFNWCRLVCVWFLYLLNKETEWKSWSFQKKTWLEVDSAKCAYVQYLTSGKCCGLHPKGTKWLA